MGKTLVIAEKPSVAADLARALGRVPRKGDHFEDDRYVITSAVGHLVELCLPGELDKQRGKWSFSNLPILPERFDLKVIEKTKDRFNLIKKLLRRPDVTEVVNACDAGREGELIFLYLMKMAGCNKPVRRLWLQSMTPEAIREGFAHLRDGQEMKPLGDAAVSRSESDWLVGINGTRAMTAFNSRGAGFQLTPVGRVQTPTLAILAEREQRIRNFQPRTFYEVHATFAVEAGAYAGRWFDEAFQKGAEEDARPERLWDREKAEAIVARCLGRPGQISEEKKPGSQIAPQLYDLTSLQREANSRLNLSARRTLQIVQALYEKHKAITYPRTDSRYLPEDYLPTVRETMRQLFPEDLASFAARALEKDWVRPNRRVFDNSKVSDHFAIIPTGVHPKSLDEMEAKVLDMIARRFVAAFYPAARFETTVRITRVEGEPFRSEGKVLLEPGWLEVYGKQAAAEDEPALCPVRLEGQAPERARTEAIEVKENQTRPPARFTEATLLSAMESAGKLVEDEDLREAMSQRGLGTPATRAQIIEGLIQDGYVLRQGRELVVTQKGLSLITLLRGIGVEALTSPELTGEWEYKLKRMERGEMGREEFMESIRRFTEEIVAKAKNYHGGEIGGHFQDLEAVCPRCGERAFKETLKTYECRGCGLVIWKNMSGRELEREEVRMLLEARRVGPLEGFRSRLGKPFQAEVILTEDFKQTFNFPEARAATMPPDAAVHPVVLESCPACKSGRVHDTGTAYACSDTAACGFRMGKVICQREIPLAELRNLAEKGETSLIPNFISKKGKRFRARLALEGSKVVFRFEERSGEEKAASSQPATGKTRSARKKPPPGP